MASSSASSVSRAARAASSTARAASVAARAASVRATASSSWRRRLASRRRRAASEKGAVKASCSRFTFLSPSPGQSLRSSCGVRGVARDARLFSSRGLYTRVHSLGGDQRACACAGVECERRVEDVAERAKGPRQGGHVGAIQRFDRRQRLRVSLDRL